MTEQVFGLENFGNTCYCNSVLQSMYHVKPFRDHILAMGQSDRPPRLSVPGKVPHAMAEAALTAEVPVPYRQPKERGSSLGARLARGLSRSSHKDKSSDDEGGAASPSGTMFVGSVDSSAVVSVGGDDLGQSPSTDTTKYGQNVPIVGLSDDPAATVEIRKKNALTRGPLINLDHSLSASYGMKESLLTALKDLFECIFENESRTGVASPTYFVETLKRENELFRSSAHQDAHEFLNFLLNRVIEEVDKAPGESNQWVKDLFMGELTNETRCMSCETVSKRDEQFVDFSIDLEPNTSVFNCLTQFSSSEILGGSNKFYCDYCGGLQEAQKRMKVRKAPKILTLHLKRFKFNEDLQRNTKILYRVLYSQYLRLPVTTDDCPNPDRLYELMSVVVHLGGGPYQGHYVTVTRTPMGWLLFDDELVEAVDSRYVYRFFGDKNQLATAYVLFYQEISQEQYELDNAYLNTTTLNLNPVPNSGATKNGTEDSDFVLTGNDIYGMSISEEEVSTSYGNNSFTASSGPGQDSIIDRRRGSAHTNGSVSSATTAGSLPIGASPPVQQGSSSLSRFDSFKRKREGSNSTPGKLFGVLRR